MFPLGGYSESMPNDEAHDPIWCDRCGLYHGDDFDCKSEEED